MVDSSDAKLCQKNTCAALITPQGRENETVFCTERGRQSLCS